jgi:hypothetical protein
VTPIELIQHVVTELAAGRRVQEHVADRALAELTRLVHPTSVGGMFPHYRWPPLDLVWARRNHERVYE